MTAVTAANVVVNATAWTQISTASVQTLQALLGNGGVIFAATQPAATVQVGDMGHRMGGGDYLSSTTGGTSWGRANDDSVSMHVGRTEG